MFNFESQLSGLAQSLQELVSANPQDRNRSWFNSHGAYLTSNFNRPSMFCCSFILHCTKDFA